MLQTVDKGFLIAGFLIGGFLVATNAGGFTTVITSLFKGGIASGGLLQGRKVQYGDVQVGGLANGASGSQGSSVGQIVGSNPFFGGGSFYTPPTF